MQGDTIIRALQQVDWDFPDYTSTQYPADINSLHWYPAAFVPQIPSILIGALSKPGDVVLDPFCGSGITLVEAARLRRRFIGVDLNPFATRIVEAKFQGLAVDGSSWFDEEIKAASEMQRLRNPKSYCDNNGIPDDVFRWFEGVTLSELLSIHKRVVERRGEENALLRQVLLSSILNRCCSQRDHYTYITDNCFPKKMVYRPALGLYAEQVSLAKKAFGDAKEQFARMHNMQWRLSDYGVAIQGDARNLQWIKDGEVDLVVTSPPYLGVNDYVRSMKLTAYFFPEQSQENAAHGEIGARWKRRRQDAFDDYMANMRSAFGEMARVLDSSKCLCLVVGSGRGRVNRAPVVEELLDILRDEFAFSVVFTKARKIKFRRIRVPGVDREHVVVLQRNRG